MPTTPAPALKVVQPVGATALLPAAAGPAASSRFPPACLGLVNMPPPSRLRAVRLPFPETCRQCAHRRLQPQRQPCAGALSMISERKPAICLRTSRGSLAVALGTLR